MTLMMFIKTKLVREFLKPKSRADAREDVRTSGVDGGWNGTDRLAKIKAHYGVPCPRGQTTSSTITEAQHELWSQPL